MSDLTPANLDGPVVPIGAGWRLKVTAHAIDRYRERVAPVSRETARERLAGLAAAIEFTGRPPVWRPGPIQAKTGYGSAPDAPDVCLIVVGRKVVTVLTRQSSELMDADWWDSQRDLRSRRRRPGRLIRIEHRTWNADSEDVGMRQRVARTA